MFDILGREQVWLGWQSGRGPGGVTKVVRKCAHSGKPLYICGRNDLLWSRPCTPTLVPHFPEIAQVRVFWLFPRQTALLHIKRINALRTWGNGNSQYANPGWQAYGRSPHFSPILGMRVPRSINSG